MDYLAITSIQIWQSQRLRLLESHLYVMPNFYCLWVSTLSLGEEKSGNQHLLDTGNSYNVRGFLFLPRFEMKTMGNREVANYVSSTKRDSMCWWECFKWTFSHSSPHPPSLINIKTISDNLSASGWRSYWGVEIFKYFPGVSDNVTDIPVAWSAMKVMMEPMMKRASTILNLSISAIFDVIQIISR